MREDQKIPWKQIKDLFDPARDSPSVAQSACELKRCRPDEPASWCWQAARNYHEGCKRANLEPQW